MAVRTVDHRLHFVGHIVDEYSASEWLKRDGDARLARDSIAGTKEGVRCDAMGCIAHTPAGARIAAVHRAEALAEDCTNAEVVISAIPTRGLCTGPKAVIDRIDVARNGAYAVWFGRTIVVRTVQELRGVRPWSRAPWQQRGRGFNSGG